MNKTRLAQALTAAGMLGVASTSNAFTIADGGIDDIGRWFFDINGHYYSAFAYATADGAGVGANDFDGFDVKTDAEIKFRPRVELENGLTIGASIDLEGESDGDQIDESYVYVEGSFGQFVIGSENSAGFQLSLNAPSALNLFQPDEPGSGESSLAIGNFIPVTAVVDSFYRGTLGTTKLEVDRNNDAKRVTYYTPKTAGVTAGLSYAHDPNQDNFGPTDCNGVNAVCDIIDAAVLFETTSEGVNLRASARYGMGKAGSNDIKVTGAGLHIGSGPLTVGFSFAKMDDASDDNGKAFDFGILFDPSSSPWSYSITHFEGENDEAAGQDELSFTVLGATHTYNQHIEFSFFLSTAELDAANAAFSNEGETAGAAVVLTY